MTTTDTAPTPRAQTRRPRIGYLVVGLLFLGFSAVWALATTGTLPTVDPRFIVPVLLVGAGGIGLVALAASSVRRRAAQVAAETEPGGPAYVAETDAGADRSSDRPSGLLFGEPETADTRTTPAESDLDDTRTTTDTGPITAPGPDPDADPGTDPTKEIPR